jgi:hypothetical protein
MLVGRIVYRRSRAVTNLQLIIVSIASRRNLGQYFPKGWQMPNTYSRDIQPRRGSLRVVCSAPPQGFKPPDGFSARVARHVSTLDRRRISSLNL